MSRLNKISAYVGFFSSIGSPSCTRRVLDVGVVALEGW